MSLVNPQPSLEGADDIPPEEENQVEDFWLRIARQSYESSSEWVDANLRYQWEKSLSLFNSKHPSGSKYHSAAYDKRSKLFRPKTRTAVRNLQSAMAIAFFSNEDVVSIQPRNPNSPEQSAAAVVAQSLVQYRLTNTIPWFQTMSSALQDAAVQGICVSHQYWDFEEQEQTYTEVDEVNNPILDEEGRATEIKQKTALTDRPAIELISPENFRIDPAADWADPVGSTPYIIHLIPMYVQDVLARMNDGEWHPLTVEQLLSTTTAEDDNTTRLVRDEPRMDPLDTDAGFGEIQDHKIVWIHKVIINKEGNDWCYFTAGTDYMLTDAKPLLEMYPWLRPGERPYVMGAVNLEAHKLYPSGTVEMTQELQAAANDIWNQRFDNVRLAMNKRYHIRRDRNIDLDALFRSVPGGAVEMDDPDTDVRVIDTRDVTASAYAEQDRINMDFDELQGNFSTSTVQGARNLNETVGGMALLAGNSSTVTEYVLRTFSETWVERVLKQLIRLEQYYETDEIVLSVAGDMAESKLGFQVDENLDNLLREEVLLKVNVGLNATNPLTKVQNLMAAIATLSNIPGVAERLNLPEIAKEVFGQLGFKDGSRFVSFDEDPRLQELMQQLEQMQAVIESDQQKIQGRMQVEQMKQEANLQAASMKSATDLRIAQIKAQLEYIDLQLKKADVKTRKDELLLQREALINQIADQEIERQAEIAESAINPSDMTQEGKVGIMARDDYNMVPYAVG
jgi:TolA-binding protein